jgi:hypothetical protein
VDGDLIMTPIGVFGPFRFLIALNLIDWPPRRVGSKHRKSYIGEENCTLDSGERYRFPHTNQTCDTSSNPSRKESD